MTVATTQDKCELNMRKHMPVADTKAECNVRLDSKYTQKTHTGHSHWNVHSRRNEQIASSTSDMHNNAHRGDNSPENVPWYLQKNTALIRLARYMTNIKFPELKAVSDTELMRTVWPVGCLHCVKTSALADTIRRTTKQHVENDRATYSFHSESYAKTKTGYDQAPISQRHTFQLPKAGVRPIFNYSYHSMSSNFAIQLQNTQSWEI
jgi:hypothetical protein